MKKVWLAAAVAAAALVVVVPASANHSWNGYHWARTANPFTLKVGDNVTPVWDSVLDTTVSDWSVSTVLDLSKVAGQSRGKCRPTVGRVEVCNGTYGNNGWLGIASVWLSGSHITQGTVKLNDTYFNTPTYNTTAWRNLVSCQEVGHTLGLDHQDTNFNNPNLGTCMDYTNDPSTNQHPNQHDYDELVTIYTHLDSFTTLDTTSVAVAGGEDPGLPAGANPGRSTYVHDLGGGRKLYTFVFWARG